MKHLTRTLLSMSLVLSIACDSDGATEVNPDASSVNTQPTPAEKETNTIADIAANNADFSTLAGALAATGLDEALQGEGPFTVFAPTNAAFDHLPEGLVASLSADQLTGILLYHVAGAELLASDVIGADSAETLNGSSVSIAIDGDTVVLDGRVQVTATDIIADNGVIHVLDAVLIPGAFPGNLVEALSSYPRFSGLVGAVAAAGLVEALQSDNEGAGFTVFAPTNNAFAGIEVPADIDVLASVLLYHVLGFTANAETAIEVASSENPQAETLQGGIISFDLVDGLNINGDTNVTYTDIEASNGVIHVIDSVLLP